MSRNGALQWRHNDHDGVSNHQPHGCLLNRLFRRRSKKISKLRVTGLCEGNSLGTVTQKILPCDDVLMGQWKCVLFVAKQFSMRSVNTSSSNSTLYWDALPYLQKTLVLISMWKGWQRVTSEPLWFEIFLLTKQEQKLHTKPALDNFVYQPIEAGWQRWVSKLFHPCFR